MAGLVTMGSVPYNPYNTAFAEFAMRGMSMAQQDMLQADARTQQGIENAFRAGEMMAQNIRHSAEMKLRQREQERLERASAAEQERLERASAAQIANDNRRMDIAEHAQQFAEQQWREGAAQRNAGVAAVEEQTRGARLKNDLTEAAFPELLDQAKTEALAQTYAAAMEPTKVQSGIIATLANAEANLGRMETARQREDRLSEFASENGLNTDQLDRLKADPYFQYAEGLPRSAQQIDTMSKQITSLMDAESGKVDWVTQKAGKLVSDDQVRMDLEKARLSITGAANLIGELSVNARALAAMKAKGQPDNGLEEKVKSDQQELERVMKETQQTMQRALLRPSRESPGANDPLGAAERAMGLMFK